MQLCPDNEADSFALSRGTVMLRDMIGLSEPNNNPGPQGDRILALDPGFEVARQHLSALCDLAVDGLAEMYQRDLHFPHTMRSVENFNGSGTRPEGDNLRYTINVAQGLAWTPETVQRQVLDGHSAIDLALSCIARAARSGEPGAVALAAWAAAETANVFAGELFGMLETLLAAPDPVETVPCAWALSAALAGRRLGDTERVQWLAARRLLDAQAPSGLFPHTVPNDHAGWERAHVGSFADQIYPIQAFARLGYADRNPAAMAAAEACAARIVALQGKEGQWWWHYDTRTGQVVEGYPVYSVHQHAMAPMGLLDLQEAGGTDYRAALIKGLGWLEQRPESRKPVISPSDCMIWRKIGRQEPAKLVRKLSALTTALVPGWRLPGLDLLFPTGKIDRECRPYEFGWLLYGWRSRGVVRRLRPEL